MRFVLATPLLIATALGIAVDSSSIINSRGDTRSYPASHTVGPAPLDAWIQTYNAAKAAGKIPNILPSRLVNGNPTYGSGVDTTASGTCSWTTQHCFGPLDVVDAPTGIWAITFDDGPTPASASLYTFLKAQGQKGSHFLIGSNILDNPTEFAQVVSNGDHLAVHTWSHPYMTTLTDLQVIGELGWTAKVISDQTGNVPAFWRPPYGDVDNRVRAIAREVFGLTTVIWGNHFDSDDWCLKEDGGQSCGTTGPQDDAGLDAELQGWINGPKTPGVITLQHELTSRSVGGFIRNFPSLLAKGWTPKTIPDIWKVDWYRNSVATGSLNATSAPTPSASSRLPAPQSTNSASVKQHFARPLLFPQHPQTLSTPGAVGDRMMSQATVERPRAPHRRISSYSGPTMAPLEFPSSGAPAKQHLLSSSTNSRCVPPQSPPTQYDGGQTRHSFAAFPLSSTLERGPSELSASTPEQIQECLPILASSISVDDSSLAITGRQRSLSVRSRDILERSYGRGDSLEQPIYRSPTLEKEFLDSKDKTELAQLVTKADKRIHMEREHSHLLASIGLTLVEQNEYLRTQLTQSPPFVSEIRERPSPSPFKAKVPLSRSLSFDVASKARKRLPSESSPGAIPTTPIRKGNHRSRLSSTTSISSLFTPSRNDFGSAASPKALAALDEQNFALTIQVSELEAEKETLEREGIKRVRKLEKDLVALRSEMQRIGLRNEELEEDKTASLFSSTGALGLSRASSRDDLQGPQKENIPKTTDNILRKSIRGPQTPHPPITAFVPASGPIVGFAPRRSISYNPPKPSQIGARGLADSPVLRNLAEEELVAQLRSKIEELQEEQEEVKEKQKEMEDLLEKARDEVLQSRNMYDCLALQLTLGGQDERKSTSWRDDDSMEGSPVRHRHRNRYSLDSHAHSESSPPASPTFESRPFHHITHKASISSAKSHRHRTLGSELGQWEDERSVNSDEDEHPSLHSGSTSTPMNTSFRCRQVSSDSTYLDTSSEIFEVGTLRHSGPPRAQEYDELAKIATDLPAVWEAEDEYGKHAPRPTKGLLRSLDWAVHTSDGEEEDLWRAQYPEAVATDFRRISFGKDSDADDEEDDRLRGARLRKRFAKGKGKQSRGEEEFSRRQMALRRMGLVLAGSGSEEDNDCNNDDDDRSARSYDEGDLSSDYDYVEKEQRENDYWPMTTKARYHPKVIVQRVTDSAFNQVFAFATYIQFFLLLSMAVLWALWQGPRQTVGLAEGRRRLR